MIQVGPMKVNSEIFVVVVGNTGKGLFSFC